MNIEDDPKITDKKVTIVGGGAAGLVCAYQLLKRGISVTVLDRGQGGGRLSDANVFCGGYQYTPRLVKELGISNKLLPYGRNQISFWTGEKMIFLTKPLGALKFFKASNLMKILPRIIELIKMRFLFRNPIDKTEEIRDLSLVEWGKKKNVPEEMINNFFYPFVTFCGEPDPNKISADYGLFFSREFLMAFLKKTMYTFEESYTLEPLSEKLMEVIGPALIKNANVTDVERKKEGFNVVYNHKGEEKSMESDIVVMATPIPEINKLVSLGLDWEYTDGYTITARGDFKYKDLLFSVSIKGENPFVVTQEKDEKGIYQKFYFYSEKFGEMAPFYHNGEFNIRGKETYRPYFGVAKPGAKTPDLEQEDNLYICGDFYRWPLSESAVASASIVAEKIEDKIKG